MWVLNPNTALSFKEPIQIIQFMVLLLFLLSSKWKHNIKTKIQWKFQDSQEDSGPYFKKQSKSISVT
jgi:hypothetical protein